MSRCTLIINIDSQVGKFQLGYHFFMEIERFVSGGYSKNCGTLGTTLYLILAGYYAKKYKVIRPTQEQLAYHFGGSRYGVSKGITALKKLNIIETSKCSYGKYGNLEYKILPSCLWISLGKRHKETVYKENDALKLNKEDALDPSSGSQNFKLCHVRESSTSKEINKLKKSIDKKERIKVLDNAVLNSIVSLLKSYNPLGLDGSKQDNLKYADLVIRYKILPYFTSQEIEVNEENMFGMLSHIFQNTDEFHKKNLTNFRYLYNNFAKIAANTQNNTVINLNEL